MKILCLFLALLFSGCLNLGKVNKKLLPDKPSQKSLECGKNLDLCKEKAAYICGFTGYEIVKKEKSSKGYRIVVECKK